MLKGIEPAARTLGLTLRVFEVRSREDFSSAFAGMREWRPDAVIALDDSVYIANRTELAAQAARHRLPVVCGFREIAEAGCLMSYAVSLTDMWYRSAAYVDKILKGAKPADLPVEQGSKFELVINLKTAKAIGLTSPETFLLRADEVIE
jgi:putative ABC transport system substrate-binding protein